MGQYAGTANKRSGNADVSQHFYYSNIIRIVKS
nr:MAG TPA: hypothetical protein [Bacteriophage sp.]